MPSRRAVLGTLSALLVGGCTESDPEEPSPTATERSFAHSLDAPTLQKVRRADGGPAIRSSAFTPTESWAPTQWVVTDASDRDALDVSAESTGRDEVATFVAETDLSTQTVLVHQYNVESCHTRQLNRVRWGEAESGPEGTAAVRVEYTTVERDDCRRETDEAVEATVVRMPTSVERLGYFGSQVG